MGAELQKVNKEASSEMKNALKNLDSLNNELKLDLMQSVLDAVGIADPTPISDGLSCLISLGRSDFIGAGLSLISIVPYVGDVVGKSAKASRFVAKTARLAKKIEGAIAIVEKLKADMLKKAASAVRKAREVVAKAKIAVTQKKCITCQKKAYSLTDNIFGTNLPTDGTWTGRVGDSIWHPDPKTVRGKELLEATKKEIKYKNGYPDFSEHVYKHNGKPVSVEIDMKGYAIKKGNTSKTTTDFKAANEAMRKIDPKWKEPKDYTWHHNEDGVTMELVHTDIHGNVPHTGGASIVKDPGY
ncbi:MAG: HNH endonuclease [Candidatus Desantisbacteria bacterium]